MCRVVHRAEVKEPGYEFVQSSSPGGGKRAWVRGWSRRTPLRLTRLISKHWAELKIRGETKCFFNELRGVFEIGGNRA